jgi:Uma2 family endonuclease
MSTATAPTSTRAKKLRRSRVPARRAKAALPAPAPGENLFVGYGSWETYLALDAAVGSRGIRVRFHAGQIEIMSISPLHELLKNRIRLLVEAWCDHRKLDFECYGSATRSRKNRSAAEPDESYVIGKGRKETPDLVIEIALSSGGLDKLSLWAELGVGEVWIWQKGKLHAFVLKAGNYEPLKASRCLPGFPLALVKDFVGIEPSSRAVRKFRRRLAAGK